MTSFRTHDTVYWDTPQSITYGEIIQKVSTTGNFHRLSLSASRIAPLNVNSTAVAS